MGDNFKLLGARLPLSGLRESVPCESECSSSIYVGMSLLKEHQPRETIFMMINSTLFSK